MPKAIVKEIYKDKPALHAANRKQWRQWLQAHHDTGKSVWLIFFRKGHEESGITYVEAVEEALCFGWIDSVVNKRDALSTYQYFSPRKAGSIWSVSNKERVARMTAQGLMTPAGQALIDIAKENGAWDAADLIDQTLMPEDMEALFGKHKKALKHFNAFPPSSKKMILQWILNAKRPETRKQRILQTIELAAQNIRANHPVNRQIK